MDDDYEDLLFARSAASPNNEWIRLQNQKTKMMGQSEAALLSPNKSTLNNQINNIVNSKSMVINHSITTTKFSGNWVVIFVAHNFLVLDGIGNFKLSQFVLEEGDNFRSVFQSQLQRDVVENNLQYVVVPNLGL